MAFFDEPPPPPQRRKRRRRRKDEYGRPTLLIPAYLTEDLVLAASGEVATSRFEVDIDEENPRSDEPFDVYRSRRSDSARFSIEYSDGRRGTLSDSSWRGVRSGRSKDAIILEPGGGGGGGGHWETQFWVEPLPPSGPVTFALEWSARGIDETLHTIDGESFQEAAGRARPLFGET